MDNLSNIWREVAGWPPEQRLALATRLLQSLPQNEGSGAGSKRQEALLQLIGIWQTEQPPSDEHVERILQEERMKKYG